MKPEADAGYIRGRLWNPFFQVVIGAALPILAVACGDTSGGDSDSDSPAPSQSPSAFHTGQDADLLLAGIDFNNTGGPRLYNHPGLVATDGSHLLLADRNNNRVLIWNSLPSGDTPPDLVLGQPDFDQNDTGNGLDQLSWPVSVTTDGERVVVADTYNNRLLVWTQFPGSSATPADFALPVAWPWGAWTDGEKLVATQTEPAQPAVFIWNTFPAGAGTPPDLTLYGGGDIGTPRTITSDGRSLIIADHNPSPDVSPGGVRGNFFWKSFPTSDDAPYDFFMADPFDPNRAWMQGDFTSDGRLVLLGSGLSIWNTFPSSGDDAPDLAITEHTYFFDGGDGSGLAAAGDRLYLSVSNSNKLVVYDGIPTDSNEVPDFAVGSPDIYTNTLLTHYFITNPLPASNGSSLFVASDFDRTLSVWKTLPGSSGAPPDGVYDVPGRVQPRSIALHGQTLALVGDDTLLIWNSLPLEGAPPDLTIPGNLGGVDLNPVTGIALDDTGLYLCDPQAGRVYVWDGVPGSSAATPVFTLNLSQAAKLSSDGAQLLVTRTNEQKVTVIDVDALASGGNPRDIGDFDELNLPEHAIVAGARLLISDTRHNRVLVWDSIDDALAGIDGATVLGQADAGSTAPAIGRDHLFWPAHMSYDGRYLWVGEYKFSGRLLRFSG